MSTLYLTDGETKGFPERGDTDYLTPAEQALVQRILRRPETFPQEFWSAVIQKVALDGEPVPRSQVQGLTQFGVNAAEAVTASQTTASSSYTNLTTAGPTIEGLSDGTYLVLINTLVSRNNSSAFGLMTVRANDDSSTDSDVRAAVGAFPPSSPATSSAAFVMDLRNNNNNKLQAKYRVNSSSFTATFANRTMFALKVGN